MSAFNTYIRLTQRRRFLFSTVRNVVRMNSTRVKSFLYANKNDARIIIRIVHPDLDNIFAESVSENIRLILQRRNVSIDLFSLRNIWENLQSNAKRLAVLEDEKKDLQEELKKLDKKVPEYEGEFKRIVSVISNLKKTMKEIKNKFDEDEENLMMAVLPLPNFSFNERTPLDGEKIVYEYKSKPTFSFQIKTHFEIGTTSNLFMKSRFSPSFYLMNEAAKFEVNALQWFNKMLLREDFKPISNVNLLKAVVVEGCGMDIFDPKSLFVARDKQDDSELGRLKSFYLTGGASLPAFGSYFTRMNVRRSSLPVKQFTIGRCYRPKADRATDDGLINSVQTTKLHFFIVAENKPVEVKAGYESILQLLKKLYESIGIHFRVVDVPIHSLSKAESSRSSLRVWMPSSDRYVEVAHVSLCNDFISRRLMSEHFTATTKGYLNILHGDVVNVNHLLAAVIENTQNDEKWTLPDRLMTMFGDQNQL